MKLQCNEPKCEGFYYDVSLGVCPKCSHREKQARDLALTALNEKQAKLLGIIARSNHRQEAKLGLTVPTADAELLELIDPAPKPAPPKKAATTTISVGKGKGRKR